MKSSYCFLIMLLYVFQLKAQPVNKTLHGSIISATTLKPVDGAILTLRHNTRSFISKTDGTFSITLTAPEDSLLITHVGYKSQTIAVNPGTVSLTITLTESFNELSDVIINTGYQSIPKERATGSFYKVNNEVLNSRVSTDILTKLDGIASGLVFNKDPDGKTQLRIRGQSTIFANAEPLIIIDNFPYDGNIGNINPNDVESIVLLKDAAAASIWGVRAGNGVIVITTKKGSYNQSLKIELSSSITTGEKPDLFYDPNYLDASDFIDVEKTLFSRGFYAAEEVSDYKTPLSPVVEILIKQRDGQLSAGDATAQIDALRGLDVRSQLLKYFYRTPLLQQHSLHISGGNDVMNYSFSGGYDKNLLSDKGSNYSRVTLSELNTYRPVKNLELSAGINYVQNNNGRDYARDEINTGGALGKNIYPYAAFADAVGNPLPILKGYRQALVDSAESHGFLNWGFSPLQEKGLYTNDIKEYDTRLTLGARYNVTKGFSLEIKYQYEKFITRRRALAKEQSYYARDLINHYSYVGADGTVSQRNIPDGDILNLYNNELSSHNGRAQLNYSNDWHKHSVFAIAGIEVREIKTNGDANSVYGYNDELATYQNVDAVTGFYPLYPTGYGQIPVNTQITGTVNRYRSYFANGSYTYNSRYTFSASGRIDQSNFFGVKTKQRAVPLWSAGFKWDIDKESFYHSAWLPYLKFRLSYGYNGNLDKTVTAFTTAYYLSNAYYTNANWAIIQTTPNPDLQWEKTGILNLAIDVETKNKRLSGTLEYYFKKGVDLMGDEVLAPSSGFPGPQGNFNFRGNFAEMKGKGIDVTINSKNIDRRIQWYTTFLLSYAADKVTKYDLTIPAFYYLGADGRAGSIYPFVGRPVYGIYTYRFAGLDPVNGDPRGYFNDTVSKDYSVISSATKFGSIVYNGVARPVISGGMNNTISFKGFSISANISYKLGYYFRRSSINYTNLFNTWAGNKDFRLRWQKPGDEKNTTVPSMPAGGDYSRDNFYLNSEVLVEKGDHIRLQDISLRYDFSKSTWKKMPFTHIQVYMYAANIGILWRANKEGLDPDYATGGIPPARTLSFGIKAGL